MAQFTQYLTELSLKDVLLCFFIVLFCLKQGGELIDWFIKRTGLETNITRKHKEAVSELAEHDKAIEEMAKRFDSIGAQIKALSDKITENERITDHRRMRELRHDILDFANCMQQRSYGKELCEEILDSYDEYEDLLEKWGEKNGRTARAIAEIKIYAASIG